jgi:biopolymer transport protein ExbB/TolQ
MGLFLWLVLGCVCAWIGSMRKRLYAAEKKVVDLRFALNRRSAELAQAKRDAEAVRNLVILDKNDAIEILKEKLKASEMERARLETLLEQKWNEAKKPKGAKKNDLQK